MKAPHFNVTMAAKGGRPRIEIYDEIGPEWLGMIEERTIAQALKDIGNATDVDVYVNSLGGNAYDGLAICNMFKAHPAKFHGRVMGIAASAATLLLCGCDTITIPKNALWMIHEPMTFAFGFKDDMQKAIDQLDSATKAGIETYAAKNKKKTREEIAALMQAETWFTGEEAVEAGFADQTEAEVQVPNVEPAAQPQNRFRNAPSQFASLLAISMRATEIPQMNPEQKPEPKPEPIPEPKPAPVPPPPTQSIVPPEQAERTRCADVFALCNQIGKPELATDFIANGTTVADVQSHILRVLINERKPVDGGGGGANPAPAPDPDAKFKVEYAADRKMLMRAGISEGDYVASRRCDEGIDGEPGVIIRA